MIEHLTVVGARPQFIKAMAISHELREKSIRNIWSIRASTSLKICQTFFEGMDTPNYNLDISCGTHAQMTGCIIIAIEEVLQKENLDWLLIYGAPILLLPPRLLRRRFIFLAAM